MKQTQKNRLMELQDQIIDLRSRQESILLDSDHESTTGSLPDERDVYDLLTQLKVIPTKNLELYVESPIKGAVGLLIVNTILKEFKQGWDSVEDFYQNVSTWGMFKGQQNEYLIACDGTHISIYRADDKSQLLTIK